MKFSKDERLTKWNTQHFNKENGVSNQASGIHPLYECTKYNSIRGRLREHVLIEGVAWPPQLEFWARRGCYKDFAEYVGRTMLLRLEEGPLHRQ